MKNNIKLVAAVFVCICLLITIQAGAREKKDSRKTDEVTFLTNLDCIVNLDLQRNHES